MSDTKIFLGRQPILDRQQNIVGYELLFRAADCSHANVRDHSRASASVIINTLAHFGYEKVLGSQRGFINVNNDLLMSDNLELLPAKRFVLELLEIVEVNNAVIERCRELKLKGFTLALDDNLFNSKYKPLYDLVDIVKIDILREPQKSLLKAKNQMSPWPIALLAEKVEQMEQFHHCFKLGFHLYQGYFFAHPVVLKQNRIDTSKTALMKLLEQVLSEAEIPEIEHTFKQHPELIYKLLRLVNSVMFGLREKIKSLRQAIVIMGMQHLKRWILMALFAGRGNEPLKNPLLELAANRGRLMELLVQKLPLLNKQQDYADLAFITGLLSLLDVQCGQSMEEITDQLNLDEEIRRALLKREGALGNLLLFSEKLEQTAFDDLVPLMGHLQLDPEDVISAQLEGINWTNSLCEAI